MRFQVTLTANAEAEFRAQYAWIAERSESGAQAWAWAFHAALDQLKRVANSCPKAPETRHRDEVIHQMTFKTRRGRPYRMLFLIRDDLVCVLHVRGPRQNLMRADEIEVPDE
jgi:plasmid stabilization system protein ParE